MAAVDILRAVLRGEEPPEAISKLGFTVSGDALNLRIDYPKGRVEQHTFPLADLATGFMHWWGSGVNFILWAAVILMTDWIEVGDIDTSDGCALWEAVWTVSGGDQPPDDSLALARKLCGE